MEVRSEHSSRHVAQASIRANSSSNVASRLIWCLKHQHRSRDSPGGLNLPAESSPGRAVPALPASATLASPQS
jgi:hypothetical protein